MLKAAKEKKPHAMKLKYVWQQTFPSVFLFLTLSVLNGLPEQC